MLNFGEAARLRAGMKEIQQIILAQSVKFSGTVSQKVDEVVETNEMKFKRIFTHEDDHFYPCSHIDQMYTAIEGMAFFVHCFNRSSFRSNSEALRERIFDPSVVALVELFAKLVRSQSTEHDEQNLQNDLFALISQRENQYADMPSFLGTI